MGRLAKVGRANTLKAQERLTPLLGTTSNFRPGKPLDMRGPLHRVVWRPLRGAPESNEGLCVAELRSTIHRDQGSNLPDAVVTVGYHSQADHSTCFDRGEPVDVFLTDSAAIDELIKRGKVGGRPH
jgi:hypothetical protein